MNKRGQNIILKEVFVFVIGIILAVSIGTLFSDFIAPEIQEFTIDKKMDQFLNHIDFLTTRVYIEAVEVADEVNITYQMNLPGELSGSKYKLEIDGREICVTISKTSDKKCLLSSLPADVVFTGKTFSGVNAEIRAYKNDAEMRIEIVSN